MKRRRHSVIQPLLEMLESRTLMSASPAAVGKAEVAAGGFSTAYQVASGPQASIQLAGKKLQGTANYGSSFNLGVLNTSVPAGQLNVVVSWGDGTSSAAYVASSPDSADSILSASHNYATPGNYHVRITAFENGQDGPLTSVTTRARVYAKRFFGVPLSANTNLAFHGSVGTFITDKPAGTWKATIFWGDGTSSEGSVEKNVPPPSIIWDAGEPSYYVLGGHTYHRPGTYVVHVTVSTPAAGEQPIQNRLGAGVRLRQGPVIIAKIQRAVVVDNGSILSIAGTYSGTYTVEPVMVSGIVGTSSGAFVFSGAGTNAALGNVTVSGTLGLGNEWKLGEGMLTLANSDGSVTVEVAAADGTTGLAGTYYYSKVAATGAYANDVFAGRLNIAIGDLSTSFISVMYSNTFTLTIF